MEAGVRPISPALQQSSGYLVGDLSPLPLLCCFLYLSPIPRRHRSSLRQRAAWRLCCSAVCGAVCAITIVDPQRFPAGAKLLWPDPGEVPRSLPRVFGRAERRMCQSAKVLPNSPRIGPLHKGGPHSKPAESYGRKDRGPRASALTCVLPAAGHWLLLFGGCWRVTQHWGYGRALECGCFPVEDPKDQGPVRYSRAVLTTARIGYSRCC